MSMITIENLCKEYPGATPLKDLNAQINKGDVICLIGPSGGGKSTLLRCLNLLEKPTSGRITFDGAEITALNYPAELVRRKIGMVFPSFNLFDNLTVIENMAVAPVHLLGLTKKAAYDGGMALLKRVGLAEKADCFPDGLTGGEKQRTAIARAVAMKPEVMLFDDPTSALDSATVGEVLQVIRNLANDGMTMLIATDEMNFAREVSNRIFYMDEGCLYEEGTPEEIFRFPKRDRTRIFMRRLRQLPLHIETADFDFIGMSTRLESFAKSNLLPAQMVRNIMLIFEETLMKEIAVRDGVFPINVMAELSEADQSVVMKIDYNGRNYNPIMEGNKLAAESVRKLAAGIKHSYIKGSNRLMIVVK